VAWALFDSLIARFHDAELWTGPYTGHRIQGASQDEIVAWALAPKRRRDTQHVVDRHPARYIFLMNLVDRLPPADFEALMQRIDPKSGQPPPMAPPDTPAEDTGEYMAAAADHARPMLAARGLAHFHRGRMQEAFDAFSKIGGSRKLREFLPYYVWSATAIGKAERVQADVKQATEPREILPDEGPEDLRVQRYYGQLGLAILAGWRGQHNESIKHLDKALNDRPYTRELMIFTDYQLMELADMLHEHTRHDAYRAFGFDLARRFQVIQPMYPWIYAFAAKLAGTREERIPYLATAIHLDRHSRRVAQMSTADQTAARSWLDLHGPMYQKLANRGAP
jgi:tetratricopeptide (TPR) repeat protein